MINKLEEYLRIAEIHRNDPELKRVDGDYIVKKLKAIQEDIVELTSIFGEEESDTEKLNKIEAVLKIYEEKVPDSVFLDPAKITRIVVVGENGREYEKWFDKCEVSLQDDGRTVKFFTK